MSLAGLPASLLPRGRRSWPTTASDRIDRSSWDDGAPWRPTIRWRRRPGCWRCRLAATPSMRRSRSSLTLGVVEPMMSGLGGDGFYHVYRKATGEAVVFNGTGPRRAPPPRSATPPASRCSGPLVVLDAGLGGRAGAPCTRDYGRRPGRACSRAPSTTPARASARRRTTATSLARPPRCLREDAPQRRGPSCATVRRRPSGRRSCSRSSRARSSRSPTRARRASIAVASRSGSRPACAEVGALVAAERSRRVRGRGQAPISIDYRGYTVARGAAQLDGLGAAAGAEDRRECSISRRWARLGRSPCTSLVEAKKLAFEDRERWGGDPRSSSTRRSTSCSRTITPRELRGPHRPRRAAAPTRAIAGAARQHDLFLRRRRRGQRRLRRSRASTAPWLWRDGRRHRHPAEQPHAPTGTSSRRTRTACARASASATR